eukprot:gene15898-19421_t
MTAVDAAVQSKLLGAENVTIVYRRGQEKMSASGYEQDHAASAGVRIVTHAAPVAVHDGAVEFAYTEEGPKGLTVTSQTFTLKADQVFKAIGQTLSGAPEGLKLEGGKIAVDGHGRTSVPGIWAGGDCASGGDDLTLDGVRGTIMADLTSNFIGIKSPNPFWLASAPPTDKKYNVERAFEAGW